MYPSLRVFQDILRECEPEWAQAEEDCKYLHCGKVRAHWYRLLVEDHNGSAQWGDCYACSQVIDANELYLAFTQAEEGL